MIFAESELIQIVTLVLGTITTLGLAYLAFRTEVLRREQMNADKKLSQVIQTQNGQTGHILATGANTARLGADTARVIANLPGSSPAEVKAAETADRAAVVAEEVLATHLSTKPTADPISK